MGKRKNCKNGKIWDETHIINTNIILHKLSFSLGFVASFVPRFKTRISDTSNLVMFFILMKFILCFFLFFYIACFQVTVLQSFLSTAVSFPVCNTLVMFNII